MKLRTICALAIVTAVFSISPAYAQLIGFRVAIAAANSPSFPGFAVAPGTVPSLIPTFPAAPTFGGPPHFQPGYLAPRPWPFATPPSPISPNRGVVVVAPGSTIYAPGATVVTGGTNVIITNTTTNPVAVPNTRPANPPAGTSRSQVIAQYGTPLISILTSTGETMQFNGGITIRLQNGLVVRP